MALRALRPDVFGGTDAVIVLGSGMFWNYRRDIVALINATHLPAIYPEREYADEGGLMAYGTNVPDNFRRAADYVDRILKGARPGDLPIQEPVRFDLVVNLKTARELGLTVPPLIPRPRRRSHRVGWNDRRWRRPAAVPGQPEALRVDAVGRLHPCSAT